MVQLEGEQKNDATKVPQSVAGDIEFFGSSLYSGVSCDNEIAKFTCMASVRVPDDEIDESADIDESSRAPVLVVAVVDKSGSMAGAKMEALKETLKFIIKELGKRDQLAIVEYDTHVKTSLKVTTMNDSGKQQAYKVCDEIKPGSATNLSGGLMEGLRLIPNDVGKEIVVSTLLLTDGLANHGIRSAKGLISMIQKAQSEGVGRCTVNTFGFGVDHDGSMLKEVAQAAEGMYYFIENEDSIATAFADCIGGLLSVRAQGVELEIESVDGIVLGEVFSPKSVSTVLEGKKVRIPLGDLQNGEERDITFEVKLPKSSCLDVQSISNLKLSFFDMTKDEMRDITANIRIARPTQESPEHKLPNLLVDRNCNRVKGAQATAAALKLADNRNFAEARALLERVIAEIKQSPSSAEEFCVTLLSELQVALNGIQDNTQYTKFGQYHMNNFCHVMAHQRCADSGVTPQAPSSSISFAQCESASMKKPLFSTKNRQRMKSKCTPLSKK